jgi:hypothetical protein
MAALSVLKVATFNSGGETLDGWNFSGNMVVLLFHYMHIHSSLAWPDRNIKENAMPCKTTYMYVHRSPVHVCYYVLCAYLLFRLHRICWTRHFLLFCDFNGRNQRQLQPNYGQVQVWNKLVPTVFLCTYVLYTIHTYVRMYILVWTMYLCSYTRLGYLNALLHSWMCMQWVLHIHMYLVYTYSMCVYICLLITAVIICLVVCLLVAQNSFVNNKIVHPCFKGEGGGNRA